MNTQFSEFQENIVENALLIISKVSANKEHAEANKSVVSYLTLNNC